MAENRNKLVLWTGQKHSGKTTSAVALVNAAHEEGFNVAGLLAPSLYRDGELLGFDALDLRNETRVLLARRKPEAGKAGRFKFLQDGLKLGNAALSAEATKSADLIVIDEFGPLELNGVGWRESVDSLIDSSNALILLIVRQELAESVLRLYADLPGCKLNAAEPKSIDEIIGMLRDFRASQRETKCSNSMEC
jgi:nucleoside-triphosphatase THEP1